MVDDALAFIAAEKTTFPVAVMYQVLGVNRTGFHNWQRRAPSDRALADAWLTERIRQIHQGSRGTYGASRIQAELRLEHDVRIGRKRVARLMRAAGIAGVRPDKPRKTTIRILGVTPATDLAERQFRPDRPNVLWVADITYLRTTEGWLYLAAVQDAFSRQIVGWSMASHMRATLVVDALQMALARWRPTPGSSTTQTRAANTSAWRSAAPRLRPGLPTRWAPAATPMTTRSPRRTSPPSRRELVRRRRRPARLELQSAVFEYIEAFYNRQRRHSTLGMLSPAAFEQLRLSPLGG